MSEPAKCPFCDGTGIDPELVCGIETLCEYCGGTGSLPVIECDDKEEE